jgi:hypothetical protein
MARRGSLLPELYASLGSVRFFCSTDFVFGHERTQWLKTTPLKKVLVLAPRPSMPPGELILAGQKPGGGRIDYIWGVWERGYDGRRS